MIDQIIPFLVVGAFALGKWFLENSGRSQGGDDPDESSMRPQPGPPRRPSRNVPAESDEEKMRRFMEALGLPPQSAPPPPVKKPETPAPKRLQRNPGNVGYPTAKPVQAPPVRPEPRTPEPSHPHLAPPMEPVAPMPEIPKAAPMGESAPAIEVASLPRMVSTVSDQPLKGSPKSRWGGRSSAAAKAQPTAGRAGAAGELKDQLRDPAALRKAIMLREILGPPKGLQSAGTSTTFSPL